MKKLVMLLMLAAGVLVAATNDPVEGVKIDKVAAKVLGKEPTIRVLIAKNVNAALLEARGAYCVVKERQKDKVLSSGRTGKRFVVQAISEGLRWGEEYPDIYEISILPRDKSTSMFVSGIQYKGSLSVYCTPKGEISIVNEVPIEDYLKSTLNAEAPNLSREALASLVIAKRTAAYVLSMQNSASDRLYDVAAEETKYYGHGVTMLKGGVDEVVESTKHIVLMNGEAPVLNVAFTKENAEELASKGFDAKKILKTMCPEGSLETAVR